MVMKSKTLSATKAVGAFAKSTRKMVTKASASAEKDKDAKDVAKKRGKSQEQNDADIAVVDPANAQIVAVETKEPTEVEIAKERTKELKAMSAADLKEMVTSFGLETGTKEAMIGRVLKHEAKLRKDALALKAKIREVVSQKKQELDSTPLPELTKQCNEAGFKGLGSKPEKVRRLLLQWQEQGGVERAFAHLALQERKQQLEGMELEQLRKLCAKCGLDAYAQEIMVERISRKEHEMGCYERPVIKEIKLVSENKQLDVVEALLASEAERKKEHELRAQREEAMESKRKELKGMSIDALKKVIAKKKLTGGEKKDEMITALMLASVQESQAEARKVELQSKSAQDVTDLLVLNGLDGTGGKDKMVKRFLEHEAQISDDLKLFERSVADAAKKRKEELEKKTNPQLKDMCEEQGLALGGGKDERIERLIEEEVKSRSFDAGVSTDMRSKRFDALMKMTKIEVLQICDDLEVDPLMKELMVERIMAHEKECPEVGQPKAKRARMSK